ncbi:MAG: hypothetical protein KDB40_19295 [Acidimicrobiales bacterium]|nr:hypothetical protein [Acidimicrobiales bacterium]
MSTPSRYEIEVRGRPTHRVLRPVVDDFRIEPTDHGTTRLVGEIRDPSHLHGLLAHFTSMNAEVVALRCLDTGPTEPTEPTEPTPEKGTTP